MTIDQALGEAVTVLSIAGIKVTTQRSQHVAVAILRAWRDGHEAGQKAILEDIDEATRKAKLEGAATREPWEERALVNRPGS